MKWRVLIIAFIWLSTCDAFAIIGRPLTPLSYAGVARRTTRRAVYAGAAVTGGYAAATVATLPAGCLPASVYYRCGGTYYQPAYDGPDVVYVEVNDPD